MVLLIPFIDSAFVHQARGWLAEVQGYSRTLAPVALLYPSTRITAAQWSHLLQHHSTAKEWACMEIPPRSEWCTLLIYGERCVMFSRSGAACFYPERCVADPGLFKGTILVGDYSSEIRGNTVVWTFRAVHAIVSRGILTVGLSLEHRMRVAQRAVAGLQDLNSPTCAWRHSAAELCRQRSVLAPGLRFLHKEEQPDMSSLWAVELAT